MKPRIKMLYAPNTCVCDMCLGIASEEKQCSKRGTALLAGLDWKKSLRQALSDAKLSHQCMEVKAQ